VHPAVQREPGFPKFVEFRVERKHQAIGASFGQVWMETGVSITGVV
jgi:hypothetical protein